MNLSIIVAGLVTGSLYALVGLSLVLVHKATRAINFALGGIGGLSGYVVYALVGAHAPYGVAAAAAVGAGAVASLVIELTVLRPLATRRPITVGMACLGVTVALQGILGWRWGYDPHPLPVVWAGGPVWTLAGISLAASQVLIIGIALGLCAATTAVVRWTPWGMTLRAASAGPSIAALLGIDRARVRMVVAIVAGALSALAVLFVVPATYLDPYQYTSFLLVAFVAVVIGGFDSLGGVIFGGLILGVLTNLLTAELSPRLTSVYTFVIVAVVLALRPHGLVGRREEGVIEPALPPRPLAGKLRRHRGRATRPGLAWRPTGNWARLLARPQPRRTTSVLAGVAVVLVLPQVLTGSAYDALPSAVAMFLAVVGTDLLMGQLGQISLGQSGFVGIGAYTSALFVSHLHLPVLVTLPVALTIGGLIGVLLGWVIGRMGGPALAVASLLFSFVIPQLATFFGSFTGGSVGLPLNLPSWLGGSIQRQYWYCVLVALVAVGAVAWLNRSRLGRSLQCVRDNEAGALALGYRPMVSKTIGFALSAALVSLAGALQGQVVGFVDPSSFSVWLSVYLVLAVVLGGSRSLWGNAIGALVITMLPLYSTRAHIPPDVFFGTVLVLAILFAPDGVVRMFSKDHRPSSSIATGAKPDSGVAEDMQRIHLSATVTLPPPTMASVVPVLAVSDLTVRYGGLTALRRVSIEVGSGEAVAVLGANGAGKSTLLRAISGLLAPASGEVQFGGVNITTWQPHRVARLGIAHVPEGRGVFPGLTVAENLQISKSAYHHAQTLEGHPDDWDESAIDLFPLVRKHYRRRAGTLSGGEQQMMVLARALAVRPRLLILDEPSLGIAPKITDQILSVLASLSAGGMSVLLVEQNAVAALELCQHAYVLSSGSVTIEGESRSLMQHPAIASAYLGAPLAETEQETYRAGSY